MDMAQQAGYTTRGAFPSSMSGNSEGGLPLQGVPDVQGAAQVMSADDGSMVPGSTKTTIRKKIMATTATNKQPLLVDRPLHSVVKGNSLTSGSDTSLDILGTNESSVLVDCSSNDGALVEDLYVIARSAVSYKAVFYISHSR